MTDRRRSSFVTLIALALAAAVGISLLGGFVPHTDDGCKVEIHCLACRWALTSTAVMAPLVVPHVNFEITGTPALDALSRRVQLPLKRPSSRGPPTSSC